MPTGPFRELRTEILAIDVGAGTQNILLYDDSYEAAFKLILPSPSVVLANAVGKCTIAMQDVVLSGETMGGGAINRALFAHVEKGLRVYMTELSARTVRDDLDHVRGKGIEIIAGDEVERTAARRRTASLTTGDTSRRFLEAVTGPLCIDFEPKIVAVAVEDHGVARRGQTDRDCRFEHFRELIPGDVARFGFESPPDHYTRMTAVKRTLAREYPKAKHLIMDSKIAAMFGALFGARRRTGIAIDAGNGHTTVASFQDSKITGIFEHHTHLLTARSLRSFISRFCDGTLKNDEVAGDGGHGCYIHRRARRGAGLVATGPRRVLVLETGPKVMPLNPHGDAMITGNVGLIECARRMYPDVVG